MSNREISSVAQEERADKISDAIKRGIKVSWEDRNFLKRYVRDQRPLWLGVDLPNGLERAQDKIKKGVKRGTRRD